MKDRMAEMQKLMPSANIGNFTMDIKGLSSGSKGNSAAVDQCLNTVDVISGMLDQSQNDVAELSTLTSSIVAEDPSSSSADNHETHEKLEEMMISSKKELMRARIKLKELGNEIKKDVPKPNRPMTAELRIKLAQHSSLSRRLMGILTEYNAVQLNYQNRCKDKIRRKLKIVGKTVTEDELEELASNPNPQIFTDFILQDSEAQKQTLQEVQDRHSELLLIESSMRELNDLFMELAVQVEDQGHKVDIIEHNIDATDVYVTKAASDVKGAMIGKQKYRKRKLWCTVAGVVALVLLILIIIISICTQSGC